MSIGGDAFLSTQAFASGSVAETLQLSQQASFSIIQFLEINMHHINLMWAIGVGVFALKFVYGLLAIKRLKSSSIAVTGAHHKKLDSIIQSLQMKKEIILAESKKIAVPVVVGFFKPMIIFPFGMLNSLSIDEVEAIMLHEISHIKRNDYLINVCVHIVEIIFYFHPAIWWISAKIRAEREYACDDIALSMDIQPLDYVKTLYKLEQTKQTNIPALSMSFAEDRHQLLNRVKRILNMKQTKNEIKEKAVATLLLLFVGVLFASNTNAVDLNKEPFEITENQVSIKTEIEAEPITIESRIEETVREIVKNVEEKNAIDTLPTKKKSSAVIIKSKDKGNNIELEYDNGEITKLKIDGKVIPKEDYDKHLELDDGIGFNRFNFDHNGSLNNLDSVLSKSFAIMFDGDQWKTLEKGMESMGKDLEKMGKKFKIIGDDISIIVEKDMEIIGDQIEKLHLEEMFEGLEGLEVLKSLEGFHQLEGLEGLEGLGDIFLDMNLDSTMINMFQFDFDALNGQINDGDVHFFDLETSPFGSSFTVTDKMGQALNKDGLLKEHKTNEITLTGKYMKINGEKMPTVIYNKYKDIYEESTGAPLSRRSKMIFEIEGLPSKRTIRAF